MKEFDFNFCEVTETLLSCWDPVPLFHKFRLFEKRFFKEMSWITVSTSDFYLFVFNILTFSGITLSITFEIARNLYRRCKSVVYGSYGPPVGSLVITYEVKVSCNFYLLIYLFF